jgi:hypothetical protein
VIKLENECRVYKANINALGAQLAQITSSRNKFDQLAPKRQRERELLVDERNELRESAHGKVIATGWLREQCDKFAQAAKPSQA